MLSEWRGAGRGDGIKSVDAGHAEVRDSPQFMSAHVHVILLFQIARSAVSMELFEKSWIGSSVGLFDHII